MHGVKTTLENGNRPMTVILRVQIELKPDQEIGPVSADLAMKVQDMLEEKFSDNAQVFVTDLKGWDF